MKHFLEELTKIPETAEMLRKIREGVSPVAVNGLQPVQRACIIELA